MNKNDLKGILYVSFTIVLWGTIGSLIDYPLLNNNIYEAGSIGQFTTFSISGFVISVIAILIFRKFMK